MVLREVFATASVPVARHAAVGNASENPARKRTGYGTWGRDGVPMVGSAIGARGVATFPRVEEEEIVGKREIET